MATLEELMARNSQDDQRRRGVTSRSVAPRSSSGVTTQQQPQQMAMSAATPGGGSRNDISQMYKDVFGREADQAGLDYWSNSGLDSNTILGHFKSSDEYKSNNSSGSGGGDQNWFNDLGGTSGIWKSAFGDSGGSYNQGHGGWDLWGRERRPSTDLSARGSGYGEGRNLRGGAPTGARLTLGNGLEIDEWGDYYSGGNKVGGGFQLDKNLLTGAGFKEAGDGSLYANVGDAMAIFRDLDNNGLWSGSEMWDGSLGTQRLGELSALSQGSGSVPGTPQAPAPGEQPPPGTTPPDEPIPPTGDPVIDEILQGYLDQANLRFMGYGYTPENDPFGLYSGYEDAAINWYGDGSRSMDGLLDAWLSGRRKEQIGVWRNQFDDQFGDDFYDEYLPSGMFDDNISGYFDEGLDTASLDQALARGQINQSQYDRAIGQYNTSVDRMRGSASNIANAQYNQLRSEIGNILAGEQAELGAWDFGMDYWSPGDIMADITSMIGNYESDFGGMLSGNIELPEMDAFLAQVLGTNSGQSSGTGYGGFYDDEDDEEDIGRGVGSRGVF